MNKERFEDLFQEKTVTGQQLQPGDKIEAVIADISGENIFLDLTRKRSLVTKIEYKRTIKKILVTTAEVAACPTAEAPPFA